MLALKHGEWGTAKLEFKAGFTTTLQTAIRFFPIIQLCPHFSFSVCKTSVLSPVFPVCDCLSASLLHSVSCFSCWAARSAIPLSLSLLIAHRSGLKGLLKASSKQYDECVACRRCHCP